MQPNTLASWTPAKLVESLFRVTRSRTMRKARSRMTWRERLRRSPVNEAIRDLIYRHIGVRVRQRQVQAANTFDPETEAYLRSHICLKPFTTMETSNRGHAHFCCPDWLPTPFGNLDADLPRQWSGRVAKKIRASILDGSYKYCSRLYCGEISNRQLVHRDSPQGRAIIADFASAPETAPLPKRIVLSHDRSCNLSCPSCRTDLILAGKAKQAKLDALFDRSVLPLMSEVTSLYITSSGDPFGSNHFRRTIKRVSKGEFPRLKIDLHTNGQLFDERGWKDLALAGRVDYVHISIDAAEPATYEILRRGGTFDRLRKNLAFVKGLREAGEIAHLEISMVVQARNFREMPAFVRLGQEFGADAVVFQMIRNWGTFSEAEFRAEFIGDQSHPRHCELVEILREPELSLPFVRVGNILGYVQH
jgi:pyruvate-formate lyase-activating enzyme